MNAKVSSSGISQLRGSQDKMAESATGPAFGLDKWNILGFGVICSEQCPCSLVLEHSANRADEDSKGRLLSKYLLRKKWGPWFCCSFGLY